MARIIVKTDDGRLLLDEKIEPGALDDQETAVNLLQGMALALASAESHDRRSYLNVVG